MITFKYKDEKLESRSVVKRPFADVFLLSKKGDWIQFHPYIDSGADITLIPLSLGRLLGFEKAGSQVVNISGISGSTSVCYKKVRTRIGNKEFEINVAWCLTDRVPPLLGRDKVFDLFHITFKQNENLIIFEKA